MNVFKMAAHRMTYAAHQMKVSSENLANLHTPLYKARCLKPLTFQKTLDAGLLKTHDRHLSSRKEATSGFSTVLYKNPQETLTGNTVSYKEELRVANSANLAHKQMGYLITSQLDMLRMALES